MKNYKMTNWKSKEIRKQMICTKWNEMVAMLTLILLNLMEFNSINQNDSDNF